MTWRTDSWLLFVAVIAIVVGAWPRGRDQRQVIVQPTRATTATSAQTFVLSIDDPRLAELEKRLQEWGRPSISTELAIAMWRLELAEFYASLPESLPAATVQQSSYSADLQAPEPAVEQATRQLDAAAAAASWKSAAVRAKRELLKLQSAQRAAVGAPPISLSGVVTPPLAPITFLVAIAFAVVVLAIVRSWEALQPTIQMQPKDRETAAVERLATAAENDAMRLELPSDWVEVTQPFGVKLRQAFQLTIVLTALIVQFV